MTETKPRISLNPASLKEWQDKQLEHIRYEYDLSSSDTVIDLGAYKGEFSEEIYKRYKCNIVAVEPTEYIKGFRYAEVINKAAGTHDGKMSFGGRSYYTSIMESGDHEYSCFDVNTLISKYDSIALLKVNIEGSEYDVLNHIIDAGLHKRINNIQVQFHQIDNAPYQKWYREIADKLYLTHEPTWYYPFCWENWRLNA